MTTIMGGPNRPGDISGMSGTKTRWTSRTWPDFRDRGQP